MLNNLIKKKFKGVKNGIETLINELDRLGYYKYVDPQKADELRKKSIETGYIYGGKESGRDFAAPAEELAEWGVENFFKSIKEYLARQNVKARVTANNQDVEGYSIRVSNKVYTIYTVEEFCKYDIWSLSTYRTFTLLNRLLKKAGSDERAYVLYSGNKQRAVFLTDEMYTAISNFPGLPEEEKPVLYEDME